MAGFEVDPGGLREASRRLEAVLSALAQTERRLTLPAETVGSSHLADRLASSWEHWERSQREISRLVADIIPALRSAADAYAATDRAVATAATG